MTCTLPLIERIQRGAMYCRDGCPGLLRALHAGYTNANGGVNVKFTEANRVTFNVDGYSLSASTDAIYDYRVKSWTDVRYKLYMTEEEFFQLSLVQEVQLTYEEYIGLCEIASILRTNQYDDCDWEDL